MCHNCTDCWLCINYHELHSKNVVEIMSQKGKPRWPFSQHCLSLLCNIHCWHSSPFPGHEQAVSQHSSVMDGRPHLFQSCNYLPSFFTGANYTAWWHKHKGVNKCLANAKRPCNCRVLCLCLKSSLCSCAHSTSDMTSFGCRHQGRNSVCPVLWMSTWRNPKSAGKRRA